MKKVLISLLALICGILIGGFGIQAENARSVTRSDRQFSHKLRCKTEADGFIRAQNKDAETYAVIVHTDYSAFANSCVIAYHNYRTTKYASSIEYEVTDLLSGESIFKKSCRLDDGGCANGKDIELLDGLDEAFSSYVSGKSNGGR